MRGWFLRHPSSEPAVLALTAETFAAAWCAARRFRDEAGGSAAPWLFGIARNLLRQYHKHNRIETAARQRLGMPLAFAECEDYERVDERDEAVALGPRLRATLAPPLKALGSWSLAHGKRVDEARERFDERLRARRAA